MRSHVLLVIPVLAILNSGCGGAGPSAPPEPGVFVASPLDLDLGAEALAVGESSTGTITLSKPAPADGAIVSLWSSDGSSLSMPVTITIPAGSYAAAFTLTNSYGGQRKSVMITASYEDAWASSSLFVPSVPPDPPCKGHSCQM